MGHFVIPGKQLIQLDRHPVQTVSYRLHCRDTFTRQGVLVLRDFLTPQVISILQQEADTLKPKAYYCNSTHNVYLRDPDPAFESDHPRNRELISDKGCVPHDHIPLEPPLQHLYTLPLFRDFLTYVLGTPVYPFADPLSSINYNYYDPGQQLNWHFDNATFAVTLMVSAPEAGGVFEYVERLRDLKSGDWNYDGVGAVLDGEHPVRQLAMPDGALVIFRGRSALHRVSPVAGEKSRILVTLNFNTEPGVRLPDLTMMDFFGRTA